MVGRNTENYRSVVQQQAEVTPVDPGSKAIEAIADVGKKIIATNQEAKITENFSKVQLDLNRINTQYQLDNESNPFGAMEKLKASRQELFDTYSKDISPFFKRAWTDSTRNLDVKENAQMEAWAFKQTRTNTVNSINTTIKNNMFQASTDGQNFGNSDETEIGSFANFSQSKNKIAGFAEKNVGMETATKLLEDYDEDYLKRFVSGVSDTNPLKALRLMDDPKVKGSFRDQQQYSKMREAVENRAMKVQDIMGEKQVLSTLKDENSILTKSLEAPISYAELQQEFSRTNMSPAAQSFFMKANGFTKADGTTKMSASEKVVEKADIYNDLHTLVSDEAGITSQKISDFQARIYKGMDNGTLDEKEGTTLLGQITAPLASKKEEQLSKFSNNPVIGDDIGFGGIQTLFEENIATVADDKDLEEINNANNQANKVKLYDNYMSELERQAQSYGLTVAQVPDLPKPQRAKIYAAAQAEAYKQFQLDTNPALKTLPDLPNQTLTGGKLVPGAAGKRDIKPNFTAAPDFIILQKNGHTARKYSNGRIEVIN